MISSRKPRSAKSLAAAVAGALSALASAAHAQEVYYFSDRARDLEVSADSETLLSFPAAPFARVCQPAGIVEFYPLSSVDELEGMLVPHGIQYKGLPTGQSAAGGAGGGGTSEAEALLARHLKLVPKRQSGQATCAIRLVNEQVINVRLTLAKMVSKPIVDFRSIYEKARGGALVTASLGSLNLFRSLVLGGDLTFLADETPSREGPDGQRSQLYTQTTDLANYTLVYVGTDKEAFKAWKFTGRAERKFRGAPLKDAKVGDFHFSAFRPVQDGARTKAPAAKYEFAKDEEFQFYVLSRADITVSEMLGRLP
jgi:hypothetical protein